MSDPFVAEIRIMGFNFAPKGWAFCNGQILPLSQNTALFSLLGTTYGGDGKSNFALPNLQAAAPMQFGQGPGLTLRDLGESGGEQTVTVLTSEMPAHNHTAMGGGLAETNSVANNLWGGGTKGGKDLYSNATTGLVTMSPFCTSVAGASQPHDNMPPYLVVNFCIALQGVFPPRT